MKLKYSFELLVLLILGLVLFLPIMPAFPVSDNLDGSWKLVMNVLLAQHVVLGKDVIYSYGIFPYLHTYFYYPDFFGVLIFFRALFIVVLLVYLHEFLCLQQRLWLRIFLPLLFLTCALPPYFSDAFYVSYGFIFTWYALSKKEVNFWGLLGCVLLAAVALIKYSFTFYTLVIILVLSYVDLKNKQFPLKLFCYLGACLLYLQWAHQPLRDLPLFIQGAITYVVGYSAALATLQNNYFALLLYLIIAYFLFKAFLNLKIIQSRNISFALGVVLLFSLFNMFKEGFVRADHVYFAYGYLLDLGVLLLIFLVGGTRAVTDLSIKWHNGLLLFLIILLFMVCHIYDNLPNPINNFYNLLNYPDLKQKYEATLTQIKQQYPLSQVQGTTDIYSYDQTILLANGLHYNPRPMFQSLTAFSPKLQQLNRDFLLSVNASDNIFFAVQPTDHRYPSIEDGLSWPVLLTRYDFKQITGLYVWLVRDPYAKRSFNNYLIGTYTYKIGELVKVPAELNNQLVWMAITFKHNVFSAFLGLIFKPQEVFIVVTLDNGQKLTYRLIPGMVEDGFLLSPLVDTTQRFAQLYTEDGRQHLLKTQQVVSIELTYKGWQKFVASQYYQVKFYKLTFIGH